MRGGDTALLLRTLRIDAARWQRVLDGYAAKGVAAADPPEARLAALGDAYRAATPAEESQLPRGASWDARVRCPACFGNGLAPAYVRAVGSNPDTAFAYGRCGRCGHGLLLAGRADDRVYASADYYGAQSPTGVGYGDYAGEREYREAKARRMLEAALAAAWISPPPRNLLEVGSGYGFSRAAAEALGLASFGVDLNPHAAAAARALYGQETFVGTLGQALASGAVQAGAWDLLLYNFVLEHVADPEAELRQAAAALRPGGGLLLVVPSMDAREVEIFGGSYRSFRSDHLHIFSRDSLTRLLERAGFGVARVSTECSAHLLRGFLSEAELGHFTAAARGRT